MNKIYLFKDATSDINLSPLVDILNDKCSFFTFREGKSEVNIKHAIISHSATHKMILKDIEDEINDAYWTLLFTEHPYDNNYFWNTAFDISVVTFYGWDYLTRLSRNNGVLYFIAAGLALDVDNSVRHDETTGCVFDYLWDKRAVDLGMRCAFICSQCLSRIGKIDLSDHILQCFNDAKELLDVLGNASKWNTDIIDYYENSNREPDQATQVADLQDSIHQLDFIPNSNDGEIDTSRNLIDSIYRSYIKLNDDNLNSRERGYVFEEFVKNFFLMIKGWEVIKCNNNMGDCEIDIVYDISSGPERLKERMGLNVYVECKYRKAKSDSRDISHFIQNIVSRNLSSGIFVSYNGIAGYSPEKWQKAEAAYKRIIEARRIQNVYVLPIVYEDIELIRTGGNIVKHLIKIMNRFVLI